VPRLTLEEIEDLACRSLLASRTSAGNARSVASSIAAAEADGIPSHGLLRLPTFCAHARAGKVDGFAEPVVENDGSATVRVDARNGFVPPAISVGLGVLLQATRMHGIAAVGIRNSYNSGVMGHHVEWLARAGLVALGFSNAPAAIAAWGGRKPVFGTNPIAFAAPRASGDPVVIDQASSVVARGEVLLRMKRGEKIPEGWGLDASGRPTTDPRGVIEGGSMVAAGGHKGTLLALMVEILSATLTGALHAADAGSLISGDGKRAGLGQLFIAVAPGRIGGPGFSGRMEEICEQMLADENVRLPGSRRFAARKAAQTEGVDVGDAVLAAARVTV